MSKVSIETEVTNVQDLEYSFEDWSLTRTPPANKRTSKGTLVMKKHPSNQECATEWLVRVVFSITTTISAINAGATVRLEPHDAVVARVDWGAIDMFSLAEGFPAESVPMNGARLVPHGDLTEQGRDEREVDLLLGGGFKIVGAGHLAIDGKIFQLIAPFEMEFVG